MESHQAQSKIISLEQLSLLVLNADRPNALLATVCEILVADCGSLWLNTGSTMSKENYTLTSVFQRPYIEEKIKKEHFHISDQNIVASKAIVGRSPIVGELGVEPFDDQWLSKPYNLDLPKLGIKMFAVVPIYDSHAKSMGVYSIGLKYRRELDSSKLVGVASIISSASEAISSRLDVLRLERRKDRHEVMAHTRIIEEKAKKILTASATESISKSELKTLHRRSKDIIRSTSVLRDSYQSSNFRERVELRMQDARFYQIKRFLQECSKSSSGNLGERNNAIAGSVIGPESDVLFHFEDLIMLFTNVYDNAFKYSVPGSVVRTRIENFQDCVIVNIINDVDYLDEEDLEAIWEYEVRGKVAEQSDIEGEGIGLGLVKDICDVYDIDISASYREENTKSATKEYRVSIVIPIVLVGEIQ